MSWARRRKCHPEPVEGNVILSPSKDALKLSEIIVILKLWGIFGRLQIKTGNMHNNERKIT
jgi:hypothetical protein